MRILVVDDGELIRKALRDFLESRPDWQVCGEAANGSEAVKKASELTPDAIVMDVNMPEMDGLEATRQILRKSEEIAILILTHHGSRRFAEHAFDAGA